MSNYLAAESAAGAEESAGAAEESAAGAAESAGAEESAAGAEESAGAAEESVAGAAVSAAGASAGLSSDLLQAANDNAKIAAKAANVNFWNFILKYPFNIDLFNLANRKICSPKSSRITIYENEDNGKPGL